MNTTHRTAAQIRKTIAARKAASALRRAYRISRQDWIDREKKGQAR